MFKYILSSLLLLTLSAANAQVGSLDPTFGSNGIQLFPTALKILSAPDKGYYLINYTSDPEFIDITKFTSNAVIDPSYGNNGHSVPVAIRIFGDAAVQPDGKILITASSTNYDIHDDQVLFRFTTSGNLDPSFNNTGYVVASLTAVTYDFPRFMTVNDELVVVVGLTQSLFGGIGFYTLYVYDMTGAYYTRSISATYLLQDLANGYFNYSVALDGTSVFLSVNTRVDVNGQQFPITETYIEKLGDPSYGQNGRIDDHADVMIVQDGKLVIPSTDYDAVTGNYGLSIRRYTAAGLPDLPFNSNGQQMVSFPNSNSLTVTSIVTQGDKFIVGGTLVNAGTGRAEFVIVRYNNDGELDTSFDGDGIQRTAVSNAGIQLQHMDVYGNRLSVVGVTTTNSSVSASVAALYILEDNGNTSLACKPDTTVATDPGICTAIVNGIDPVTNNIAGIQFTLSGATTGNGTGTASGTRFNKGTTTVAYTLKNDPATTCTFTVTVLDKEAPRISEVVTNYSYIWPPNHKMWEINLNYMVTDNCGESKTSLSITSNDAGGEMNTADWRIIDNHHLWLRAERQGNNPRIYTITITSIDAAWNKASQKLRVTVAKDPTRSEPLITDRTSKFDDIDGLLVRVVSNPASNSFRIETKSLSMDKISLRVLNSQGAVVEIRTGLSPNGQIIAGETFAPGLYFAELRQGDKKVVVRLVKL